MPSLQLSSSAAKQVVGDLQHPAQLHYQIHQFHWNMWFVLELVGVRGWMTSNDLYDLCLGEKFEAVDSAMHILLDLGGVLSQCCSSRDEQLVQALGGAEVILKVEVEVDVIVEFHH